MILGIGEDIVDINRFQEAIKRSPQMIERILTPSEMIYAKKLSPKKRTAYYAKRFAGKEALSKACGTGIVKELHWLDLEILNNKKGAPIATFSEKACLSFQGISY